MSIAASPVVPGQVLAGKYRIERVLGAGAMGVVVVAEHLQLERRVAIKFLLPEVLTNEQAVLRFAREAKAAARIRSEHIARVLDVAALEGGEPYMVMEYLEGRDLEGLLQERGPLPVAEVADYLLQALEALCEAHLAGVVHRDLKPSNLFLAQRPDGMPIVKILDFGISKIASTDQQAMTQTQSIMGSPLYMAPEQMRATKSVDQRADIWSMGVVFYELVTGQWPFSAESMAQLISTVMFDPTPLPSASRTDLPPEVDAIVLKCLAKEPAGRFQNVGELAVAIAPLAPEGARVSVDRIQRMLRASGVELPALAASSSGRLATSDTSVPAATPALASTGPTQAWQATQGDVHKPSRPWGLLAIGAVVLLAGTAFWFGQHATPAPPAGSALSTTGPSAPSAAVATPSPPPVGSPLPSEVLAPLPAPSTTVVASTSASTVAAPPPGPAPHGATAGKPPVHAPSASTPPSPAPPPAATSTAGGATDFGGRH